MCCTAPTTRFARQLTARHCRSAATTCTSRASSTRPTRPGIPTILDSVSRGERAGAWPTSTVFALARPPLARCSLPRCGCIADRSPLHSVRVAHARTSSLARWCAFASHVFHLDCIQVSAVPPKPAPACLQTAHACPVAFECALTLSCRHTNHSLPSQRWLKTRSACPLCNKDWEYSKIEKVRPRC